PDDVRRAVREQVRWGADFVKVMTTGARSNEMEDPEPTQFTDGEFAALVDEAHRLGYKVCAHAEGLNGVEASIRHGMDTIEHGMYLNQRRDLLDEMAKRGQFLVPTLTGYYSMAGFGSEVIDPADAPSDPQMGAMLVNLAKHNLEEGTKSMRVAQDVGVKIALGSDGGASPNDTALELVRMVHHGLSSAQALTSATKVAAEALGLENYVGSVQTGKLADLVIVDGDPLEDPGILLRSEAIWLVLQLGRPVAGQALEQDVERLFPTNGRAG
ncbi:MAG: amidohydrolase family protein, partial [Acidimicrobiales bacterium]